MPDFTRINAPRVEKIEAMIATILKSARSRKVGDDDVAALLAPVAALLSPPPVAEPATEPGPPVVTTKPPSSVPLAEPPHQHRIAMFVDTLPAPHLPSYLLHISNRVCEIADVGKDGS